MDQQKLSSLLSEMGTILVWDSLWFDPSDHDGRMARQLRLEEITRELHIQIFFDTGGTVLANGRWRDELILRLSKGRFDLKSQIASVYISTSHTHIPVKR